MTRFIIRRLLSLIPTVFIIIALSFIIARAAPGGPFDAGRNLPAGVAARLQATYHLDEPLPAQFGRYLWGLVIKGDLGPSIRYADHSVNELIARALPTSLLLGLAAFVLAVCLGLAVGVASALNHNRWPDHLLMSLAVLGISVPLFVIGPLLALVFAIQLKLLPVAGWLSGRAGAFTLVLPALTLALPCLAQVARLSRASMIEVWRSGYVRTARAKGLSEPMLILRHAAKPAILPVLSYLGPAFAGIATGSVVVEQIFAIPGLGRIFVQSALNRDYTLILGAVIVGALILVLLNFLVDLIYGFLDPRIACK
jgi:oligopeptide transport system permease protein